VWWHAAPIVSFADRWNIGRTGDGSVTISGLQFGVLFDLSPTTSLEDSVNHACSCTSWTTGTMVVCNARASRAGIVREVVTVGGAVGTRTQKFTFDGTQAYRPALREPFSALGRMSTGVPACMLCRMLSRAAPAASFSDPPNAVRTGTGSVTISGLNFGVYCFTPTGSLEDSSDHACTSTSWTSATSAACRVQASRGSPGRGIVRDAMTVVGVVGTRQMFTYDGTPLGQRASWQDVFDAAPKLRMCDRVAGCVKL
jgi:hypothetical protein